MNPTKLPILHPSRGGYTAVDRERNVCDMLEDGKCYGKQESEQVEGDPERGECCFKHGSRVGLVEKDLQLAKESAPQTSGRCTHRQKEEPVPRP